MKLTHLTAHNWRNFKTIDVPIGDRLFIVGPNASGKSNLLDIFRFLSDLVANGGGLAAAIQRRGGFSQVRSLFARSSHGGRIVVAATLTDEVDDTVWRYELEIGVEQRGLHRPLVVSERVTHNGSVVISRPDKEDRADSERLTQTHLEQIVANKSFRTVAEQFARTHYFHLVPQLIRDPSRVIGSQDDPFGGDFIAQMNAVQSRTRDAWLRRMQSALQSAVPEFDSLALETDSAGRPHLVAGYRNWRHNPTKQRENAFSDGTLRLIGLLWTIVSQPAAGGMLLLEEPELSLNSAVVRMLPAVLASAQRGQNTQVLLSTHAPEILDDEGVLAHEILVLRVTGDGTTASLLSEIDEVSDEVEAGLPKSDIVDGLIAPSDLLAYLRWDAGLVHDQHCRRGRI